MTSRPKKTVFSRHETFSLRYAWLTKGWREFVDQGNTDDEKAMLPLGLGKNMVKSIKYWMKACQIVDEDFTPTEIGKKILGKGGKDNYLEHHASLWIIHWLLATNDKLATAWYWFFNEYQKKEFTTEEIQTSLYDRYTQDSDRKISRSSTDKDAQMIIRMYSESKNHNKKSLDDSLDSLLSTLGLIEESRSEKLFHSSRKPRPELPIEVIAYAIFDLMKNDDKKIRAIKYLMHAEDDEPSIGSVFRLDEPGLLSKLELLQDNYPKIFKIDNDIYPQLSILIDDFDQMKFIDDAYGSRGNTHEY